MLVCMIARQSPSGRVAALLVLAALAASSISAQPQSRHTAYTLTTDDGLPQGISALARDQQGFVWIGTIDGLARWDGSRIVVYRTQSVKGDQPSGLPDNAILALAVGREGTLWVGTSKGLARLDRATETFHTVEAGPECVLAQSIATFRGSVWTGGVDACVLEGDHLVPLGLATDVGSGANVSVWSDDVHGALATMRKVRPRRACHLEGRTCARKIEGTAGLGYAHVDGGRYTVVSDSLLGPTGYVIPLGSRSVNFSLASGDGGLWVGTTEGLLHVTPGRHEPLWAWRGPLVHRVVPDEQGRVWIGHAGGLTLFAPAALLADQTQPLPTVRTNGMLVDRDGRRFVATQTGLYERGPNGDRKHVLLPSDPNAAVWWVGEGEGGALFAGTKRDGLFVRRPNSDRWERDRRIGTTFPTRFVGEVGGTTYVMGSSVAYRLDSDRAVALTGGATNFAFASRDGQTWLGTDRGIHRLEGDSLGAPLVVGRAWSIDQTPDGALWVAMVGQGLCRIAPDSLDPAVATVESRCLTVADGLLANAVYGVRVVGDVVWASSARGLIRIDSKTMALDVFTTADGLPQDNFDLMSHAYGRGDTLLFGGAWGYVAIDGRQKRAASPGSRVVVSQARVEERSVRGLLSGGDTLRLDHDAATFALDLATPDAAAAQRVRYRLMGYDDAERTTSLPASISYARLPPGDYELEASADGPALRFSHSRHPGVVAIRVGARPRRTVARCARRRRRVRPRTFRAAARARSAACAARTWPKQESANACASPATCTTGRCRRSIRSATPSTGWRATVPNCTPDTERVRILATGVAGELRGVVRALRPDPLGVLGLAGSLRALGRKVDDGASGMRVDVTT